MSAPAIAIEALRFRWPGQAADCLDIPRLTVGRGEHIFLSGPSGSGKSTLLALLGGVALARSGSVQVNGTDLARLPPTARDALRVDHCGFIFQQFNLIPWLPVLDNVLLPCRFSARRRQRALAPSPTPPTLADAAGRLLRHLDLAPALWGKPARQLSVGQQQRVAAARALIGRPEIVIADEPTSALDAALQQRFVDLLLDECAAAGATLLFVSHDQRLAAHFPRRLALAEINRAPAEGDAQ